MIDHYYGTVTATPGKGEYIIVESKDFKADCVEVIIPQVMARRPKIGDKIRYIYFSTPSGLVFGFFTNFDDEAPMYIEAEDDSLPVNVEEFGE